MPVLKSPPSEARPRRRPDPASQLRLEAGAAKGPQLRPDHPAVDRLRLLDKQAVKRRAGSLRKLAHRKSGPSP